MPRPPGYSHSMAEILEPGPSYPTQVSNRLPAGASWWCGLAFVQDCTVTQSSSNPTPLLSLTPFTGASLHCSLRLPIYSCLLLPLSPTGISWTPKSVLVFASQRTKPTPYKMKKISSLELPRRNNLEGHSQWWEYKLGLLYSTLYIQDLVQQLT